MGELVSLKQQQKDSATYQAAVAARAATGAAAANLRKRCNQCEACLTSQVTPVTVCSDPCDTSYLVFATSQTVKEEKSILANFSGVSCTQ